MNRDLQATHEILSLLESSKSLSDRILDYISGISLTVDEAGKILRANREVTKYLNRDHEDVLGLPLSSFFKPTTWEIFKREFTQITSGTHVSVEFELPIDIHQGPETHYYWQIQPLKLSPYGAMPKLYTVIGRDISELKRALSKIVRMETDLELTKAVQSLLLPHNNSFSNGDFDLSGFCAPADKVGGDFWWYGLMKDQSLLVFMGDLTGHGVGPAMVTSLICGTFHTIKDLQQQSGTLNMVEIFDMMNTRLLELHGTPFWMTAVALLIKPQLKKAEVMIAGGPPVVQLKKQGDYEFHFKPSSVLGSGPLSLFTTEVPYTSQDRFVLLTDGILEDPVLNGRDGWKATMRFLTSHLKLSPKENCTRMLETIIGRPHQENNTADDKTMAIIDCK